MILFCRGQHKFFRAIPHNSKCRYGERGAADAKPKAQIILDAAKVSAASGGYSEPKQGQRSQSARGFCPRSTMRVPQPDIIEHFGNADAVPQLPERHLELCGIALESVAYSQTFAFLPRRDDGPTTTHFPSNFAFFSPYRPKIRYQALQSLKNHSKIKRYVL